MPIRPDRQNKRRQTATTPASGPLPTGSLPPAHAGRAEEDARQDPLAVSQERIETGQHSNTEAKAKRITEEATHHQTQEQIRTTQAPSAPPDTVSVPRAMTHSPATPENVPAVAPLQAALSMPEPIKRIVVPLDGTTYGERALPYVAPIAHMTGADVTLLHVITEQAPHARKAISRSADRLRSEAPSTPRADLTGHLVTSQALLAKQAVQAEDLCISAPSPAEGIERVVERLDADLIILATHARHGIQQQLLGSVGDRLVQHARTPVLLIPPRVEIPTTPFLALSRVLVPLDGSLLAEQALAPILRMARHIVPNEKSKMHIVLFYVADNQISRRDGVRYVEGLRARMLTQEFPATVDVASAVVVGSPSGAIVGAAEHGIINLPDYPAPFDLVAMATHGRGGIQRWLYGSVAAYILPRVKKPVLLVHPKELGLSDM